MRPRKSPSGEPAAYNADLCRATRRLRTRMDRASARIESLETQLAAERASIQRERDALIARLESPEAERDLLLLCQQLLNEEVVRAVGLPAPRGLCEVCGGLGRGMTQSLLDKRLSEHCQVHGLAPETPPTDHRFWPHVGAGHYRDRSWLRDTPRERWG